MEKCSEIFSIFKKCPWLSLEAFKVLYLVGGFFEPFHRFLAILLNSMPMEMFQTHFIRDLRNEFSRKNLVTSNKDVDGSRDLMLSSIISKMCIAFNELYSHSEPKISREWHWLGHSDDDGNVIIWDFLHQHLCSPGHQYLFKRIWVFSETHWAYIEWDDLSAI